MMLDYNSLLIALGVSASCLTITVMGSWFARRPETFLLTCTGGLALVVAGIFVYSFYVAHPGPLLCGATFVLFVLGFSVIWAAGYQFRHGSLSRQRVVVGTIIGLAVTLPPLALGYDALAFIGENTVIALLLFATAGEYWSSRKEAPVPLYGISFLYAMSAVTFVLCAAVLVCDGKLVIGHAPENWAEDLSLAVCIAGMTGIGALSLALHQWRQAVRHRIEANTDALTGLLNRRALFDLYGQRPFTASMAVIAFDIDRFKTVNDQYGHAAGDIILRQFAEELSHSLRTSDIVARMGGEEFALVLEDILPGRAEQVAERVREAFAAREVMVGEKSLRCTVSAGIAFGSNGRTAFDNVLNAADRALYVAKRSGRNRVELAEFLHSVSPEPSRSVS